MVKHVMYRCTPNFEGANIRFLFENVDEVSLHVFARSLTPFRFGPYWPSHRDKSLFTLIQRLM